MCTPWLLSIPQEHSWPVIGNVPLIITCFLSCVSFPITAGPCSPPPACLLIYVTLSLCPFPAWFLGKLFKNPDSSSNLSSCWQSAYFLHVEVKPFHDLDLFFFFYHFYVLWNDYSKVTRLPRNWIEQDTSQNSKLDICVGALLGFYVGFSHPVLLSFLWPFPLKLVSIKLFIWVCVCIYIKGFITKIFWF